MRKYKDFGLSAERLRELLSYDPLTGVFTRRISAGGKRAGTIAGSVDKIGYYEIGVDGVSYFAHRLAWLYMTGEWPKEDLDHENLNKSDTRFENLREATHRQNMFNLPKRADNTTGFIGVIVHDDGKRYRARYYRDGKTIHVGLFDTAEGAAEAYQQAIAYRGEFKHNAHGEGNQTA